MILSRLARAALLAALALLALAAAAPSAQAAPRIDAPEAPKPGRTITVKLSGFPPGALIAVQFGLENAGNCCVSNAFHPADGDGYLIPDSGRRTLRLRMPRAYARCVAAGCPDRGWTRYRKGDRVYALAFDGTQEDLDLYVRDRIRIG